MGWFRPDDKPAAPQQDEPYSLDKVRALLDEVGQTRLQISDPKLKVLLTLIARNGEPFLARNSPDGVPSDSNIMQFQENLMAVRRVLEQYVAIQRDLDYPNRAEQLEKAFEAVNGFATRVLSKATPSGSEVMTNFSVDTQILSAQRFN